MRILLLGGSKFMGLTLVEQLIKQLDKYSNEKNSLFIVNRGNVYWNGLFYKLIEGKTNIHHFISDRTDKHKFKDCLAEIKKFILSSQESDSVQSENSESLFDFILDFTCFKKSEVKILLKNLNYSFKTYLLISTDSTYNASELSLKRNYQFFIDNKENPPQVVEEEAVWCEDKKIRKLLKQRDDYGYKKLKCEIELKNIFTSEKLYDQGRNFFILRLPDVLGTYDESYRIWYYIQWVKHSSLKPIEFENEDMVRKLSFVEKNDVIELIIRIVFNKYEQTLDIEKVANQEYNLGCLENITLVEMIDFISAKLNLKYQSVIVEQNALTYYPSVTFGPVSITKAMSMLNFKPTELAKSIEGEMTFFEKNGRLYEREYKDMIKDLPKKIRQFHLAEQIKLQVTGNK